MKRTVFNNVYYTQEFNPVRQWYGVIDTEKSSYRLEYPYPTKVRSLAEKWMEQQAAKVNGRLVAFNLIK